MIGSATGDRITGFSGSTGWEFLFYEMERQRTDAVAAFRATATPVIAVRTSRTSWQRW